MAAINKEYYALAVIPPLHIVGNFITMMNRPKLNPLTWIVEHPKIETNFLMPTKIPQEFLHPKQSLLIERHKLAVAKEVRPDLKAVIGVDLIKGVDDVTKEARQDVEAIYGRDYSGGDYNSVHSLNCEYCEGHGWWPGGSVPVLMDEVTWTCADPCKFCGSHNHFEYEEMCGATECNTAHHSSVIVKSKGLYNALDDMRKKLCVES